MTMISHHAPFNEDTPFIENTSPKAFIVNVEVLGSCGEGVGSIAEEGEVDQRK